MNILTTPQTPIHSLPRTSEALDIDLYVKRDDLFPFTGGGNKARIVNSILLSVEGQGYDTLITTGGIQSNLARVVAVKAAERGMNCHLALHCPQGQPPDITGNLLLMKLAGATVKVVQPADIHDTLLITEDRCRKNGLNPLIIEGGGHCISGYCSHFDAALEASAQFKEINWFPEFIILASGTGTTQAGLIAGFQNSGIKTKIIGISIARKNPRGHDILSEAYKEICSYKNIKPNEGIIHFRDEWIDGGYEQAGYEVLKTINSIGKLDGLMLDPTYTGKAFWGLSEMVKKGEIPKGSRVLFWHTGGMLNLLSAKNHIDRMISH